MCLCAVDALPAEPAHRRLNIDPFSAPAHLERVAPQARPRYRLKLDKLDFCSIVDNPAQPNAKTLLFKRAPAGDEVVGRARLTKVNDELGLAFFWAFTSTNPDGTPHHDLQGDAIDQASVMKVAMDFMLEGGAADEMHDGQPGAGRVIFAMPWDPEVASAYGESCKSSGLMIVVKPRADVLAKLKDGTYNGVSIAGMGTREAVKSALFPRETSKAAVLTSLVDGHQHTLDPNDPATSCWGLSTSYQTAEGAESGHSHPWVYDGAGAITIAADSGHTHTVVATVTPAAMAAATARAAAEQSAISAVPTAVIDEPSDGIPITVADEESSGKTINVVIAARAPASISTRPIAAPTLNPQPESTMADPIVKTETITKFVAVVLTAAMGAYHKSLSAPEQEAFLAKSDVEREAIVGPIEKARRDAETVANEVVYTSQLDGSVFRKSDDARMVAYAKAADASALAERTARLEKRADAELGHCGKPLAIRARLLKAVDAEFTVEADRKEVTELLKGLDHAMKELGKPAGANDGTDVTTSNPSTELVAHVTKYQADNKIATYEQALAKAAGSDPKTRDLLDQVADFRAAARA